MPGSPLAHLYRAWSLLELKDYIEAEKALNTALQLDINYVPTYLIAGRVNLERGKAETALEMLTKYGTYVPEKSWQFYYSLGKAYYLTGNDLEQAEQMLNQAESLGGNISELFQTRALVYFGQGNLEEAVADAFNARSMDRDDFELNLFLGKMLYDGKKFSLALVYLNISEQVAENEKDLAGVYYWRALILESLDKMEEAKLDWQNLLNLPRAYVPDDWEFEAEEKLLPTATPTLTPSPTSTATSTINPTATPTFTATLSPTETPTPDVIASFTPSITP